MGAFERCPSRRQCARTAFAAVTIACASLISPAGATPVEVGRYTRLAYGADSAQIHPAEGGAFGRQGRSAHSASRGPLERHFEIALPVGRAFEPVVDTRGRVFVAGSQGLCGLDAEGRVVFHHSLGATSGSPALRPDGTVVVATRGLGLWFVSAEGRVLHQVPLEGVRGAPLVLPDGSVVVALASSRLVRVDEAGVVRFDVSLEVKQVGQDTAHIHRAVSSNDDLDVLAGPTRAASGPIVLGGRNGLWFVRVDGYEPRYYPLASPALTPPLVDSAGRAWVFCADRILRRMDPDGRSLEIPIAHTVASQARLSVTSDGALRVPLAGGVVVSVTSYGRSTRWAESDQALPLGGVIDGAGRYVVVNGAGGLLVFGVDGALELNTSTGTRGAGPPVLLPGQSMLLLTLNDTLQRWGPARGHGTP